MPEGKLQIPSSKFQGSSKHQIPKERRSLPTESVAKFIRLLKDSPSGAVFNPWWQVDKENDIDRKTPQIRRRQLRAYLCARLKSAKLALIGEALGYRGGHFSGIAMTSERMLLGKMKIAGIEWPLAILTIPATRTSKPGVCPAGFSEPTATIVWSTLLRLGLRPEEFVLWNAFPWHPFDPLVGMLSNRQPNKAEQSAGFTVLEAFLELFPRVQIIALGRIAAAQLAPRRVAAQCVRHPASGGARQFRKHMTKLCDYRKVSRQ